MAEIVVSLIIENLVQLLVHEAKFLMGIQVKVANIKDELEIIQSFLKDADARTEIGDMSNVEKTWVKQIREEACHIEDVIDEYILHLAKCSHGRRPGLYFLHKVFRFTIKLKARSVIAYKIQDINKNLKEKRERAVRYHFNTINQGGLGSDTRSDTWLDPQVESLFIEEAEVVDIESHRDKLINWLVEGSSNHMVCSVVRIGGLGKTTLVKKVYENEKIVAHFNCYAWITVSQSYKMEELLREMIKQFYKAKKKFAPKEIDTMKVISLIEELKHYLCEQRYVVIFYDIWNIGFWEHIKCAFPENGKGGRIIITTRSEDVAPSNKESPYYYVYKLPPLPLEKALELFYKKVFQWEKGQCPPELYDLSCVIVERCGGLPLAIVAIGGLLSTKAKVVFEWCKVLDSLSLEFETNSRLRSITKIISFSYRDLPNNLKACFLYLSMFPKDYSINCARLTRLWIAEGFVKEKKGKMLEDVTHDYLSELIHRSLVQVAQVDFVGKVRTCRVHDMMREVIVSRSEELSFCHVSMSNCSIFNGIGRHLSIQNNVNTPLEGTSTSQTRLILMVGVVKVSNSFLATCFENFKLMKTLDFEGAPIDYIPKKVGNLFHLRYLRLRDTKVHILPKSIGKLHNFETLDLKRSLVSELPKEINRLLKLRYLAAYFINRDIEYNIDHQCAVKISSGIGKLESLKKLQKVEVNNNTLISELGRLRQLRKLSISKLKRENGIALCTTLEKIIHLQSLKISAISEQEDIEL
ncbi:disease resistance protein RPM1-like [Quercus suber]|uniref:disease resistance protein RPM1-like n=1 Tax=Quercus suber TaxID=58331 RepID=UPI0032E02AE3